MASVPYARVRDLADWVGQDIDDGDRRAQAVLRAASNRVRTYIDDDSVTDGWADITAPDGTENRIPPTVTDVVVQCAARVWINPQGLTTEANDDYTRRFGDDARVGIYLTDDEKADLNDFKPTGRGGLAVISTTRGECELDQYLDVINSATGTHTSEKMPFLPPDV